MFEALLPKGAPFFELLLKQNSILCAVAETLVLAFEDHRTYEDAHRKISALEAEADKIHLTITRHLSQTFITPIDREDILHINKVQEETVDLLHNMANRLQIFEFNRIRFPMLQLAKTLQAMVVLTSSMLQGLSQKKDSHNTREFLSLRDECEMLLSMGLGELYDAGNENPENILGILKWTRAYDRMEKTVNQVVDLAEIIEEAVLKNA